MVIKLSILVSGLGIILWLAYLGKSIIDNRTEEQLLISSLLNDVTILRSQMGEFKKEIEELKKIAVDRTAS